MEKKYETPIVAIMRFNTETILRLSGERDGEEPRQGMAPGFDFDDIF